MIIGRTADAATLFDTDGISVRFMNGPVEGNNIRSAAEANNLLQQVSKVFHHSSNQESLPHYRASSRRECLISQLVACNNALRAALCKFFPLEKHANLLDKLSKQLSHPTNFVIGLLSSEGSCKLRFHTAADQVLRHHPSGDQPGQESAAAAGHQPSSFLPVEEACAGDCDHRRRAHRGASGRGAIGHRQQQALLGTGTPGPRRSRLPVCTGRVLAECSKSTTHACCTLQLHSRESLSCTPSLET